MNTFRLNARYTYVCTANINRFIYFKRFFVFFFVPDVTLSMRLGCQVKKDKAVIRSSPSHALAIPPEEEEKNKQTKMTKREKKKINILSSCKLAKWETPSGPSEIVLPVFKKHISNIYVYLYTCVIYIWNVHFFLSATPHPTPHPQNTHPPLPSPSATCDWRTEMQWSEYIRATSPQQ